MEAVNKSEAFVVNFSATEMRIIQFILASQYTDDEVIERLDVTQQLIDNTKIKAVSVLCGIQC